MSRLENRCKRMRVEETRPVTILEGRDCSHNSKDTTQSSPAITTTPAIHTRTTTTSEKPAEDTCTVVTRSADNTQNNHSLSTPVLGTPMTSSEPLDDKLSPLLLLQPDECVITPFGMAKVVHCETEDRAMPSTKRQFVLTFVVIKHNDGGVDYDHDPAATTSTRKEKQQQHSFTFSTNEELVDAGYFSIRTDAEKAFVAVAVEWTGKKGLIYTIDTRPETTLRLGFYPNERAITSRGLATVIGVDIEGRLLFEIVSTSKPHLSFKTKEAFVRNRVFPIRTDEDKAFVAVAVEWAANDGRVYCVDTRAEATLRLGFNAREQIITPRGLATLIGVEIDGSVLFEIKHNLKTRRYCFSKESFEKNGFRPIRTDEEKVFAAIAVGWACKINTRVYTVDTRTETLNALGFRPNERAITSQGLATVVGVDVGGRLLFEVVSTSKAHFSYTTKADLERYCVRPIRTDAEKAFVAVAVEWRANNNTFIPYTAVYVLDMRPEATLPFGFYPNEEVITPDGLSTVIGVDIYGKVLFEVHRTQRPISYNYTKKAFEKHAFYPIRTDADRAFLEVAVEWTSKNERDIYTLDTRPEATLRLGFYPNEHVITPDGLARVIGVDFRGLLLFDFIRISADPVRFDHQTKAGFEEDDFRPIRTEKEKKFAAVSVDWTSKSGAVFTLDTSARKMLVFGFRPNEPVITQRGLTTVVGVDIDDCVLFKLIANEKPFFSTYKSKESFSGYGIYPIHSQKEKQFLSHATEWKVSSSDDADDSDDSDGDGYDRVFFYDARPEATIVLGLKPNDQIITHRGITTVLGVDIEGDLLLKINRNGKSMLCPIRTKKKLDQTSFRVIRTDKEVEFSKVAVEVPVKDREKNVSTVDTRPEVALLAFGLTPSERLITPHGLATVIGVDIDDNLVYELISSTTADCLTYEIGKKDFFCNRNNFRCGRNEEERRFMAVAVNWRSPKGHLYVLDTRPETTLALGFYPNERIMTAANGLATISGVDIDGNLLFFEESRTKRPLICSKAEAEELEGFVAIRTDAQKAFVAVAVEWTADDGDVYILDTRPEALQPFGFYPSERVISPDGLSTIIGVDIDGGLQTVVLATSEPIVYDRRTKEEFEKDGFHTLRTDAEKAFAAVATEHRKRFDETDVVLLDTRPETLHKMGFSDLQEIFQEPNSPDFSFTVAGVDINGDAFFHMITKDIGTFCIFRVSFRTRAAFVAGFFKRSQSEGTVTTQTKKKVVADLKTTLTPGGSSMSTTAPLTTRNANSAASNTAARSIHNPTTLPVSVRTVTLPSGAVYTGAHTRAGQRHGNGTMRSADRSWRYKGQWQQGRPHGSGTLRMKVGLTEAVYEGRWVLGVPHGRGALCVESVSERRRYRGRWAHGRRAMTATEVGAVRLSGGTALLSHRPVRTVPAKNDTRKKKNIQKKKNAVTVRPSLVAMLFAKHDEVQRMVAAVAEACLNAALPSTGVISHLRSPAASTTTAPSVESTPRGISHLRPPASVLPACSVPCTASPSKASESPPRLAVKPPDATSRTSSTRVLRRFLLL